MKIVKNCILASGCGTNYSSIVKRVILERERKNTNDFNLAIGDGHK